MSKKLAGSSYIKATVIKTDDEGISVEVNFSNVEYAEAYACCLSLVMDLVDGDSNKLNNFFTSCIMMMAEKGGDYGKKEASKVVDSTK